MVQEKVIM